MVVNLQYSEEEIWEFLSEIPDPEIPVISVVELGVVRKIDTTQKKITITITPTYTGCPAMQAFEDDIISKLKEKGIEEISVNTVFTPAWTTDWINDEARAKLKKYGIAPPIRGSQDKGILFSSENKVVPCPKCNSNNTTLKSQFGSTACKALYQCKDCLEPFDYFKCI
ncbi:MAG: 1,2-phenylacetyl-CoA epoxidase subunit PaaD [Vicingaceae bacterium]